MRTAAIDVGRNLLILKQILIDKYGSRKPPEADIKEWADALGAIAGATVDPYEPPRTGSSHFPKYIIEKLTALLGESAIFVAYLVDSPNDTFITEHIRDKTLASVARDSAKGKFAFHPNYKVDFITS